MWDPKLLYVSREPEPPREAPRPASERPVVTARVPPPRRRQFAKRARELSRTDVLRLLGFKNYQAYCASSFWKTIRARVLERAHHICESCRTCAAEIVHHTNYRLDTMSGMNDAALLAVCADCHDRWHAQPKTTRPKNKQGCLKAERRFWRLELERLQRKTRRRSKTVSIGSIAAPVLRKSGL